MFLRFKLLATSFLWISLSSIVANNIQVTGIEVVDPNYPQGFTHVQFNLAWENSWRSTNFENNYKTSWDAAWIFIKFRQNPSGPWQHASLHNSGHSSGTGTPMVIQYGLSDENAVYDASTNPVRGVFVYRSQNGQGTFSNSGIRLRWNYAENGVTDGTLLDVRVYAIEMVYVAAGKFRLGSGGGEAGSFYRFPNTATPYQITSENALSISAATGSLYYSASSLAGDQAGTIHASFPKGVAGFYLMKHEISQQQYVGFLNSLTRQQQNSRTATNLAEGVTSVVNRYVMTNSSTPQFRNGIRCNSAIPATGSLEFYCDLNGNGVAGDADDGQWTAANFISWMDAAAFADWAGLRPATELEFEKASRGQLNAVASEFAWGSTSITPSTGLSSAGTASETHSLSGANINSGDHPSMQFPVRIGSFARSTTNRAGAGAGFYGNLDLSGNLWEMTVSVGHSTGRNFTGVHGDGSLTTQGHANTSNWPGLVSGAVTTATGTGNRGGSWRNSGSLLTVSNRTYAAEALASRSETVGMRAARKAPVQHFLCGNSQIVDIDGNAYYTIDLAGKCWMRDDLNTSRYKNGEAIGDAHAYAQYNESMGDLYGSVYVWWAAVDARGVCPTGWRVPNSGEFTQLINSVGGETIAGQRLKGERIEPTPHPRWNSSAWNPNNSSGFSAYPTGRITGNGIHTELGRNAAYWTTESVPFNSANAFNTSTWFDSNSFFITNSPKGYHYSVRCIKE